MIGFFLKNKAAFSGAVIIAILSFIPGHDLPESPFQMADIVVHIGMYAGWMILIKWERRQYSHGTHRFENIIIFITMTIFGGMVELVQENWISGRFGDVKDFLANAFGTALGIALSMFISQFRNKST